MQYQTTAKELAVAQNNLAATLSVHGMHGASHEANKNGSWRTKANAKPLNVVRTRGTRPRNHGGTGCEFHAS